MTALQLKQLDELFQVEIQKFTEIFTKKMIKILRQKKPYDPTKPKKKATGFMAIVQCSTKFLDFLQNNCDYYDEKISMKAATKLTYNFIKDNPDEDLSELMPKINDYEKVKYNQVMGMISHHFPRIMSKKVHEFMNETSENQKYITQNIYTKISSFSTST